MNKCVIVRNKDGAYCAYVGVNPTGGSYTHSLKYAKVFSTREAATNDLCVESEHIESLDDQLLGMG
jgi:hypothetical protein